MKIKLSQLILASIASLQASVTLQAAPMGTAFTYQGRLNNGGAPAPDGVYDFAFGLWDAASDGSLIWSPFGNPRILTGVPVTNGLFTVSLDYGAAAFTSGEARWLQLQVNTNRVTPLATLNPRQRVTPTPQALYAGIADTATTASGVAPGAITGPALAPGSVNSPAIADGSIAPADLTPSLLNSTFWKLGGNSGTTAGVDFLGTTDDEPLELKANGQRILRLEPTSSGPNLIGGSPANIVSPGVVGGTIGGGGWLGGSGIFIIDERNRVTDNFSTVAGGARNVAGNRTGTASDGAYGTVGGGYSNEAAGEQSTVSGGRGNKAMALNTALGGGQINHAGAANGTIAGGFSNTNLTEYGTIGGGQQNVITTNATHSAIAGGNLNRIESVDYGPGFGIAPADASVIAGGQQNTISAATHAAILGGIDNSASGKASAVLAGEQNSAVFNHSVVSGHGAVSRASYSSTHGNRFSQPGDSQAARYVLKALTPGNISQLLSGPRVPVGSAVSFTALISAKAFGNASAGFEVKGLIRNYGSVVAFVGTPMVTALGRDGLSASTVTVEIGTGGFLAFRVLSGSPLDVRWVASLETSEVTF